MLDFDLILCNFHGRIRIRAGFGTNNIDHCTRLCHASSVAALLESIGSGAVTTTYGDVQNAEVALLAVHSRSDEIQMTLGYVQRELVAWRFRIQLFNLPNNALG